jgi:hypothetical protein
MSSSYNSNDFFDNDDFDNTLEEIITDIFNSDEFVNFLDALHTTQSLADTYYYPEELQIPLFGPAVREEDEEEEKEVEFETVKYKKDVDRPKEECSVCLIEFEDDDDVTQLKCHHTFHSHCISEWSQYKADCPNCREKFKS